MVIHLRITGQVQGVGYRASFAQQAKALALAGWVRNRSDGSVEALISGTANALEAMMQWARIGPPGARVDAISSSEVNELNSGISRFDILPTK